MLSPCPRSLSACLPSPRRYDQLRAALRSPVLAAALNEQFPFQRSMGSATYFVHKALVAMPRSLLLVRAGQAAGRRGRRRCLALGVMRELAPDEFVFPLSQPQ